jgi:hypothetical protein
MDEVLAELMLKDHGKINLMLSKVIEIIGSDFNAAKMEFFAFDKHLKQHLFIEDNAIFALFEGFSDKDTGNVFQLLEEHAQIQNLVELARENFNNNKEPDLKKLREMIIKHSDFEMNKFYLNMDKKLSELEKKDILSKIHEIAMD